MMDPGMTPDCTICSRQHNEEQPCPRRLARACTSTTIENIKALTQADRDAFGKMFPHANISAYEDLVEDAIADQLELYAMGILP